MYQEKKINCNYVILCPDDDVSRVKSTASSIRANSEHTISCVVPETMPRPSVMAAKQVCPVFIGGKTITSLMNVGIHTGGPEWNLLIIAGSWVRPNLERKMSYFIKDDKDILFPVAERKCNFVDGTINGILIHKRTFEEVGDFDECCPLEDCKLFWTLEAIDKGCTFKAIVGTQVC